METFIEDEINNKWYDGRRKRIEKKDYIRGSKAKRGGFKH